MPRAIYPSAGDRSPRATILWLFAVIAGWAVLAVINSRMPEGAAALATTPWLVWQFPPLIVVPMVIAVVWYVRGERRGKATRRARDALFAAALFSLFLVLLSPIEGFSDAFLTIHQVEHMTLQMTAPMLLILAAPQAALLRGMPDWLRHRLVPAIMGRGALHRAFAVVSRPVPATLLLVGVHDFWMIPRFHDVSLIDPVIHEFWHATLFASGLIFFFRLLDPRPAPLGASLLARLLMCWIAEMNAILLGFYFTFKSVVLYHAYDRMAPFWHIAALADERVGGIVMWDQGTMMVALGGLMALHRIANREGRSAARLAGIGRPAVGRGAFLAEKRRSNRAIAFGLAGFVGSVLILTFIAAVAYNRTVGRADHPAAAGGEFRAIRPSARIMRRSAPPQVPGRRAAEDWQPATGRECCEPTRSPSNSGGRE